MQDSIVFDYTGYGSVISILKPLIGTSGWLELSKLTVESFEVEEFLIFAACTDAGDVLDDETCRKLMLLPAEVAKHGQQLSPQDLTPVRKKEIAGRIKEVEGRNAQFFDEEVIKLDRWSDDLKQGLEREIKDLDKEIREARKVSALAASLKDKLEAQKKMKAMEATRNKKRRELFDAQDRIDEQRDGLIGKIEKQLRQRQSLETLFVVRWSLQG